MSEGTRPAPDGLVIADKPAGLTSHDVVARIRRLAGTRRVGHAGTLDPMATGVLVTGVGKATRLLGYLAAGEKEYTGTVRLGQSTDTDDAEGEVTAGASAAGVTAAALDAAAAALTGTISQVPPGYSAIKVGGARAYALARRGEAPVLAAREVTVLSLSIVAVRRPAADLLDADIAVTCSSGTYIRALARDLGAALGTGGHLTALRRTRVGPYRADDARTLEQLEASLEITTLAAAAAAAFPRRDLTADEAARVAHGGALALASPGSGGAGGAAGSGGAGGAAGSGGAGGAAGSGGAGSGPGDAAGSGRAGDGPVAAFAPDGALVALLAEAKGQARPVAVFVS